MTEKTENKIKIYHYECVSSTNKIAMELECPNHLLTVIADNQTGGRGRLGRHFYSYNGGLYMSVILKMSEISIPVNLITAAAALSVKNALVDAGITNVSIKWVNDILQNQRKICGILTEAKTYEGEIEQIVVGIGINLAEHIGDFPNEIKNKARSVGFDGDKQSFASEIVLKLSEYLAWKPDEIVSEYLKSLAFLGEVAEFTDYSDNNAKIEGEILGVTKDCFLIIKLPNGEERVLSSGEII